MCLQERRVSHGLKIENDSDVERVDRNFIRRKTAAASLWGLPHFVGDAVSVMFQCLASVYDAGPAWKQHREIVPCFPGHRRGTDDNPRIRFPALFPAGGRLQRSPLCRRPGHHWDVIDWFLTLSPRGLKYQWKWMWIKIKGVRYN